MFQFVGMLGIMAIVSIAVFGLMYVSKPPRDHKKLSH